MMDAPYLLQHRQSFQRLQNDSHTTLQGDVIQMMSTATNKAYCLDPGK